MQELEKILEELNRRINEYVDHDYARGSGDVVKGLSIAKSIIRKHMNDGWIPVEERLPEERNLYLATAESAGFYFRLIGHWNAPGWTEETGQQKIIAWRPLPEPYHPERSEE